MFLGTLVGMRHWYTGEFDNAVSLTATYGLTAGAPAGVYSFSVYADSRGFNPAGGDGGFAADWNYNSPAYRLVNPVFNFAVVNT
ncbi:MAG: hypothetical protein LC733_03225 [Actinobacteria bacterium]|nr:hypothetical protein [Actinomycetota bacterium]